MLTRWWYKGGGGYACCSERSKKNCKENHVSLKCKWCYAIEDWSVMVTQHCLCYDDVEIIGHNQNHGS